jgi:hypothetical protein
MWVREFAHGEWKAFLAEHEKQWKKAGEEGYMVTIQGAASETPHSTCRGPMKLWVRDGLIIRAELHLSRQGYDDYVYYMLL